MLAEFRGQKEEEQRLLMQKKFDSAWKEVQESVSVSLNHHLGFSVINVHYISVYVYA